MPSAEPLNPRFLTPAASLNRLLIAGSSGLTGYDTLSSRFIYEQIREYAPRLGIPPELVAGQMAEMFIRFDSCFESPDAAIRAAARDIAERFGRNLGALLLTLRRGNPDSRIARADWDESYWEYWAGTRRIVLGGGLIRGHLRDHLIADVRAVFSEAEIPAPELALDPHGPYLPLVGAARCVDSGYQTALALDFGGTHIKRALARYQAGVLVALEPLPTLATNWDGDPDQTSLRAFLAMVEATICQSWDKARPDCPVIAMSLASYLDPDGRPRERQGSVYALLNTLTPNLQRALSTAIRAHAGRDLGVRLIHDGTAGATAHPGSAVITFGTAIGIGYGPAVEHPLPRAEVVRIGR